MFDLNASIAPGSKGMFYCHDTYGLGHLRRTLALANHFQANVPGLSQLIVTGSPVAEQFRFPQGTDYVKLPSVTKNGNGDYEPRSLLSGIDMVRDMRRDILLSAARHYQPDFFIVDHAPAGLRGEVVQTLRHLKQAFPETKLIVGLRDVMDEASAVRRSWAREGIYELLDDVYDLILVYGDRGFYDVVQEYGLSCRAAAKTRFVGYIGREPGRRPREEVRASLEMATDKLVVVTGGEGGDAALLYEAMLQDLSNSSDSNFDCLIVNGPLQSEATRSRMRKQCGTRGNVHFLDFTSDLASYLGAADAIVSMGGYNSVCEILALGLPAIIVPRTKPRQEQLIRARMLSHRGLVQMVHPSELKPGALLGAIEEVLAKPSVERPGFPMDGLGNIVSALGTLMRLPRQAWDPAADDVDCARFASA